MTRRWVLDSSPLIFLAKIDFLPVLLQLCSQPVIPQGVYEEILIGVKHDPARRWLSTRGYQLVQIVQPISPLIENWNLGLGETQTLAYCYNTNSYEAILDDAQARKCAKTLCIPIRGTLGLIMLAKREHLIDSVDPYITQLLKCGFRIDKKILSTILLWKND